MDMAGGIIAALTRIQEQADLIRHGGAEVPGGLSLAETHCVHWAGALPEANVTRIALHMGVTRGAISKMVRKLEAKGLLVAGRAPDNNKELRFSLTAAGDRVFEEHLHCHEAAWAAKRNILAGYTEREQRLLLDFLDKIAAFAARRHDVEEPHGERDDD
jgi:DNA-binding MarR family transcriptional regulator